MVAARRTATASLLAAQKLARNTDGPLVVSTTSAQAVALRAMPRPHLLQELRLGWLGSGGGAVCGGGGGLGARSELARPLIAESGAV